MIKVERPEAPPSLDFSVADSPASKERQVLLDHLEDHGELSADPKFNVYSNTDVKEALKKAFHGKCAYCEVSATAGFDGDVEHYRPKKGVTEAKKLGIPHPGYWWLAMDWSNLLLSCQHCNQSRRKLIHEPGQDEAAIEKELLEGRLKTTGKANYFPVEDNQWVVKNTESIDSEKPLLIDPMRIDPAKLLKWEFERSISTVMARNNDPRALSTIEILGLNRRELTEARVMVLNRLRRTRETILKRLVRIAEEESDAIASMLLETVFEAMDNLKEDGTSGNQFSGMTRAFRKQLAAEVSEILLAGAHT